MRIEVKNIEKLNAIKNTFSLNNPTATVDFMIDNFIDKIKENNQLINQNMALKIQLKLKNSKSLP